MNNSTTIPCVYLNRLNDLVTNKENNVFTIIHSLDSIVDNEVQEIDNIKNRLISISTMIVNNAKNSNISTIYKQAKILARDFETYAKKLDIGSQINSITLYGLDEDTILELQDSINDHKKVLKKKLDELTNEYKKFLDMANDKYTKMDSKNRTIAIQIVKNLISNNGNKNNTLPDLYIDKYTSIDNTSTILEENKLIDIVVGVIANGASLAFDIVKKYWGLIIGVISVNYLTNNLLFNILSDLGVSISNFVSFTLTSLTIILGCCLVIYIYYKVYDEYYNTRNEELNKKLEYANSIAKNSNSRTKLNDNEESSFRGFNNKSSYRPEGSSKDIKEDPRYNVF